MKKIKYIPFVIMVLIFTLSIGFSALNKNLMVSDIGAQIRIIKDIRITGITPNGNTGDGLAVSEDYNVSNVTPSLSLPNEDSTVTYTIQVTNIGNTVMGIGDITGCPSNLICELSGYTIGEPLCDGTGKCSLGAIKEFNITIKYAEGSYDASNTSFDLKLDFDFRRFYNVTYKNAPRGHNYKAYVMEGIEFTQDGVPAGGGTMLYTNSGTKIVGATYNLTNKYFTIPADKVTDDITVQFRTLGEYINKLYTDGSKTSITHNSVSYNRVASLGLMNDRLAGDAGVDDGNVRYYGATPNNYIYFNCKDYNNQSESTCEKWRIIGVFNDKVKLTRNSSIGTYSYNNSSSNWKGTFMHYLLNPGFALYDKGASLYWRAEKSTMGTCTTSSANSVPCDFTSVGLQNDDTRNFITPETLYFYSPAGLFGGVVHFETMYKYEHGNGSLYKENDPTWTGKVALIYPSDYYYSTDISNSNCNTQIWNIRAACSNTSYMKQSVDMWTITPGASTYNTAWYIKASGQVANEDVANTNAIIPSLYLETNTIFIEGAGTSYNPYRIYPNADNY